MSTTLQDIKVSIYKNKKRLGKEIQESKELFFLLKKSTHKKLTSEEKKKVKEQLLDICKSVPALAVFLLPGGAILLPLLIKLIPDILPSSFREDSIDIDLK
ncbi:MAG: LETM1 domain-containing protein [Polaribacter sp.]|nr:LETM1 domain-containing protein [Polaribacter sp.]MDG1812038.1 LETM1 domain-containing protein [Polaribacter sp.]MDG1993703.1 LETM1 domain-containing protein [Polaribacter sp.]